MHLVILSALAGMACTDKQNRAVPVEVTMTKAKLFDKIKGGWAGQTIGCTYGGPTEFRYPGTMIQDYIPINWPDGYINGIMKMNRVCMMMFIWI